MSAVFLHSPPDPLGHIGDQEFQVAFAAFLGQACPITAPLAGRYFGKKGAVLDVYGANLAAASLPGQGHRRLHNMLQALLKSMVKLGGMYSKIEAVNLLPPLKGPDRVIKQLERAAAAGDHGLKISPLVVNNDLKGGAFPIILQQFRQAVGVAIVRGNAQHKLSRLHSVRQGHPLASEIC
ncbi:hypothetical protein THAOC_21458 [Thalassiosira oceanica]|uniref:Uncharacterized protein n=1 Tax=Thalassiosira oceanica TaxID=159749 RepID=K0RXA6_THAOC|nr:hypothetical protein THAOC_21458 [Thalassiosira oceanica]|eukprot:EJK58418.1 hypothetical protein THAOC_21458 [Thalassiosira oceanica]